MELLTIQHKDFELSIECTKFDVTWEKAKNNVGEEALQSSYSWSDGVESVVFLKGSDKEMPIEQGVQAKAVFFDNTDYPVWVDFKDYVRRAVWLHPAKRQRAFYLPSAHSCRLPELWQ